MSRKARRQAVAPSGPSLIPEAARPAVDTLDPRLGFEDDTGPAEAPSVVQSLRYGEGGGTPTVPPGGDCPKCGLEVLLLPNLKAHVGVCNGNRVGF